MKKNVIHFLTLALALALLSLPAVAQTTSKDSSTNSMAEGQGRHHGMPSVDERVQHLTQALNLSADQQAKVKSVLQDQQNQVSSLKQDTSLSQEDRRAKFQQIRQDTHQKIRDVLNDDQKAIFDQVKARRQERMGKHGNHSDMGTPDKQ